MTEHNMIVQSVKATTGEDRTLKNMIRAPLGSPDDESFQVRFSSHVPSQIMFHSLGANFKINYQYDGGPKQVFELTPNGHKTLIAPTGAKSFYAKISDVTIIKPSMASVMATFR